MARRHGRLLAQTLLSKLSCPLLMPWQSYGIRRLCSELPNSKSDGNDAREGDGDGEEGREGDDGSRKVAVFWDLDNKPPTNVPPYDAAVRLVEMAAGFGEVVDVAAYANRYAFSYLPRWVKEQRRERRQLDRLERAGIVKVSLSLPFLPSFGSSPALFFPGSLPCVCRGFSIHSSH